MVLSFEEVWPDRETGIIDAARQAVQIPLPGSDPVDTLGVIPGEIPGEIPVDTLGVTPGEIPGETPVDTLGVIPGEIPGEIPGATPDTLATGEPGDISTGFIGSEKRFYPLATRNAVLAAGFLGNPSGWPQGVIIGGEGTDLNLSLYSQVFLNLGEDVTQPGELYIVVEPGPQVRHPVWGNRLGRKIRIKGIIQIVDTSGRTSQGVLVAVFDAVSRRDRVIPAPEADARPWKEFIPVQEGRTGFVVARANADGNMHPYDMLFIDGGAEEGIQIGDLYVLKRPRNERGRLRFFEDEVARAVVIAVQEETATAMILTVKDSVIGAGERVTLIGRSVFAYPGEGG